jgi:hypothetical protein
VSARSRAWFVAVAFGLACTEDPTAPGRCPDFCPPGQISVVDTILTTVVERDSAFRGYQVPAEATILVASNVPGVIDSRPVIKFQPLGTHVSLPGDTAANQNPILGSDSALVTMTIVRRDTNAENLRLRLYRLPLTLDSSSTFGGLAGPFTDSLVREVNVDSLIALTGRRDSATGDSVRVDTASVTVIVRLDSTQARFVASDSGQLAMGVRIAADAPTSVALGSNESASAPIVVWFVRVDSVGTTTRVSRVTAPLFDSYVVDPPPAALDSTLAVGGMPSARSLVRIALPPALQDSIQILRATLLLVPSTPARGAPIDSFTLVAHAVAADLGGKSPLVVSSVLNDSSYFGLAPVVVGSTDTVQIEITRILRRWATDTAAPHAVMLRSGAESLVLSQIRFQPSRHATLRPVLRLTYTARFPFGAP